MNIGDVMLLVMLGGLLVALGVWLGILLRPRQVSSLDRLLLGADRPFEPDTSEVLEEEKEDEDPALPMDPDNPPFPRVYHWRAGRPTRQCHCHGRTLQDGETILFWPNPDVEGAFWLVCKPEDADA